MIQGLLPGLSLVLALSVVEAQAQVVGSGDSPLFRGEELLLNGSYAAAADVLQMADGLDRQDGLVGASRAYAMMGNYQRAREVLVEEIGADNYADQPLLATQLAEVMRLTGESAEALEILAAVVDGNAEPPVRSLVQYGDLLLFSGDKQGAYGVLDQAVQRYNDGLVFASEDVAMVALASWRLGNFHDANSLFNEATRANPQNLEALALWGDLFNEKYNAADAERTYQEALDVNSRYVPALVGIARVVGDERALQRALAINPNSVPAMETYGQLLMRNGREDDAREYFDRVLGLNPESLDTLGVLAADAALNERSDEYEQYYQRVQSFSPGNPDFLGDIADAFGNNYRFTEAVAYARAAIEEDPEYWQGYTLLGSNLIRLGEEEEGKANLEIGFENDPFNVRTSNMLKVFDTLATYETLESEHFKVHMSSRDAQILWPYMEPLLEESYDTLTAKYGFEPEGPILIEVFEETEDFAVRSVGLPDIGPLVGICFGKVITLISPDTLTANWQEIVWHEFMHVITLQMTDNRMPRWLSEGISVWEEKEGRPYWGRDQGLDLVRAAEEGQLLHIGELKRSPMHATVPTWDSPIFSPIWWLTTSASSTDLKNWLNWSSNMPLSRKTASALPRSLMSHLISSMTVFRTGFSAVSKRLMSMSTPRTSPMRGRVMVMAYARIPARFWPSFITTRP
ncbi:MAG: tetratricopeptide repeat protein [Pseudohongiellaceae bacterium]